MKTRILRIFGLTFLTALLFCACELSTTSTQIYEKYHEEDGFSQIIFPPQFVMKFISDEKTDQRDVIDNMDDIRILFYNDKNNENKSREYFNKIKKRLSQEGFEDMLVINEKNTKVLIKIKSKNDKVRELVALSNSDDNFSMLMLSGKVDLNKISKVAKDLDLTNIQDLDGFSPFKNDR